MNYTLVKRMNTVGKVGYIITIIVIVIMIIASVAVAGCGVALSVLPKDLVSAEVAGQADVTLSKEVFGSVSDDIVSGVNQGAGEIHDIGNGVVFASAEEVDGSAVIHANVDKIHVQSGDFTPAIWVALVVIITIIVCAFFFKSLMKELSVAESPFTDGIIAKMRNFAIAILAASIVSSICKAIITGIFSMGHGFAFSFDFGSIITAAIIFVLATVFRYGAQLQKESDETL